jgi:tRNA (guanine-N7-)-methyltransferase
MSCAARYGVAASAPFDSTPYFGRTAPVVLEIGFGMGETTAAIAAAQPDVDFVGVEMHLPGVGALLRRVDDAKLTNVRILRNAAVDVGANIAPGSLAGIHVYFPDPWPKKRHHKRRLIQPPLVRALARLADDGYLHAATDWQPYADEILGVLTAEPTLRNTADGFAMRPQWRPLTKLSSAASRGHAVFDLLFTKRPA